MLILFKMDKEAVKIARLWDTALQSHEHYSSAEFSYISQVT